MLVVEDRGGICRQSGRRVGAVTDRSRRYIPIAWPFSSAQPNGNCASGRRGFRRSIVMGLRRSIAVPIGLVAAIIPATSVFAAQAAGSSVLYSSMVPSPGNVPSVGFEATQAAEFGNEITLTRAAKIGTVTVTMSSWGCQTGGLFQHLRDHPGIHIHGADHAEPLPGPRQQPDDLAGHRWLGSTGRVDHLGHQDVAQDPLQALRQPHEVHRR